MRIKESGSGKSWNYWDGPVLVSFSKKEFPTEADVEKYLKKCKGEITGALELAKDRYFVGSLDQGTEINAAVTRVSFKKATEATAEYEEESV